MTLRSANAIGETDVTLGTASSSGVIKTRMVMSCQRTVRPVTRTFDHVLGTSEVRRWRIEKVQAGKESDMKGSMPLTILYDQVILNEGKDRSSRYNLLIVLLPYSLGSLLDHFPILKGTSLAYIVTSYPVRSWRGDAMIGMCQGCQHYVPEVGHTYFGSIRAQTVGVVPCHR